MDELPPIVPPQDAGRPRYHREAGPGDAFRWLAAGWRDLLRNPLTSLLYGVLVFLVSVVVIVGLYALALDYVLFPALAGFVVVGPILAVGLYEKSRRIARREPCALADMLRAGPAAGGQLLFVGVLLLVLVLLWMRAAVLLYALFFGVRGFPGTDQLVASLFTTSHGWGLLVVGTLVGGVFAAFAFAVSVFAIPMLLDRRVDAFSAMGTSMALAWHNFPVMVTWGTIVLLLTGLGLAAGLVGLVLVFPLLGHATWHAWVAMRD